MLNQVPESLKRLVLGVILYIKCSTDYTNTQTHKYTNQTFLNYVHRNDIRFRVIKDEIK